MHGLWSMDMKSGVDCAAMSKLIWSPVVILLNSLLPFPWGQVRVNLICLYSYYYSFSLLAQRKRIKRNGTRIIWSFGLRCAPQSCREFKNSLRSNSLNSFIGIFSGAHLSNVRNCRQMLMGTTALQGYNDRSFWALNYTLN